MAETTQAGGTTSSSRNVDYELHYFEGIRGDAQPIRWILIDANANWNEKLVSFDQWDSKYKADESFSGLFRTLPVLQVNAANLRISQLLPIVSYLGRKLNYYGSDTSAENVARVDSICSAAVLDVALPISKFMHLFARFPDLQFANVYSQYVPKIENILKRLDYLLGDRNFFCGDKITTADLLVFEAYEVCLLAFGPLLAAKYTHLDKLHDRIKERPNIKAWRMSGNMPSDITMSTKYKEFLRLVRDRFTADNSSLESMGATGTKKFDELKQLGKAMRKGQQGGDIKGKSFDVKDRDVGEGEALKGKKKQQQAGGKASGVGVPLKTGVKGTK